MIRSDQDGLSSLLAQILREMSHGVEGAAEALHAFNSQRDLRAALTAWLGPSFLEQPFLTREALKSRITADIARIDRLLNAQTNAILHHPRVQRLEASWRGLAYLTEHKPDSANIKIRVLDVKWSELARDAERAIEFDQTLLFRKVYEEEFGTPGGRPYGLLLADYAVQHRPGPGHPTNDVQVLTSIAQVAAAAFVPTIIAANPALFGADSFADLDRRLDLKRLFAQHEYIPWRRLARSEDARFLGVVAPRVLMRKPYRKCVKRIDGFPFEEDVQGPDNSKYLWGNAVYALGAVAMRAFDASGWFEDIVGTYRTKISGGAVTGLPMHSFETDADGVAPKFQTEIRLTDENERDFALQGFIPLCHCRYTSLAAFHNVPSLHLPEQFTTRAAARNEELSSRLNLMLCVSRFAHYIKVLVRDQMGKYTSPAMVEEHLHRWLHQYVSADSTMAANIRHRFPLRSASVQVREIPGRPGVYACIAHLKPHVQGDLAVAAMKLVTELPVDQDVSVPQLVNVR